MTRAELRKIAQAARGLASDFAEGRGPVLEPHTFCGCAIGETLKRAGVAQDSVHDQISTGIEIDEPSGFLLTAATWAMFGTEHATGRATDPLPGAVVFPLLWLADELDAQR